MLLVSYYYRTIHFFFNLLLLNYIGYLNEYSWKTIPRGGEKSSDIWCNFFILYLYHFVVFLMHAFCT